MSEVTNYPEFYQAVEASYELDASQIEEATIAFNDLFVELMLQNMEMVNRREIIKGKPKASLLRHISVDNQYYTLELDDSSTVDPKKAQPQ